MSAPAPPPARVIPFAATLSPMSAFAHCFIPTLIGLGLALAIHLGVILPRFGTGSTDLNRMVDLGRRLDARLDDVPTLAFIGDSVTVEGIDAREVAKAAPAGWRVLNLGINGCDRAELDVIVPKLAKAAPKAVCIVLRSLSIAQPPDVEVDGAYAYNLGGFATAWPADWIESDTPGVPPEKVAMLTKPRLEAEIHFRTAIQQLINNRLRARFRAGIKASGTDDWDAPFNMTASISGTTLDSHIKVLGEELLEGVKNGTTRHERDLEKLINRLAASGCMPVLVSAPIHPRLRETFGPTAARVRELATSMAAAHGGLYADATLLLDETGFADGQHPSEKGRMLLSAFIGSKLPAPAAASGH